MFLYLATSAFYRLMYIVKLGMTLNFTVNKCRFEMPAGLKRFAFCALFKTL